MAVTYSTFLPNIPQILKSKWHLLQRSQRLREVFHRNPMVAFKRGKNLKDVLVHGKTKRVVQGQRTGRQDCTKNCVICKRMYEGDMHVRGARNGCITTYDRTIGCRSMNVIYGLWCKTCRQICYVGETGGCLYTRIQNHLSSIRTPNPTVALPVRHHFCAPDHSIADVQVVGLERVWSQSVDYRRARERRWMNLLGTNGTAGGMNKRYG